MTLKVTEKDKQTVDAYIAKIQSDPEQSKKIDAILQGYHVLTLCTTCGKVFVDLPMNKFLVLPKYNVDGFVSARWYFEAQLHICQNRKHQVVGYGSGVPSYNFSLATIVNCKKFGCSLDVLGELAQKTLDWLNKNGFT